MGQCPYKHPTGVIIWVTPGLRVEANVLCSIHRLDPSIYFGAICLDVLPQPFLSAGGKAYVVLKWFQVRPRIARFRPAG
jgi:hypothetical protein